MTATKIRTNTKAEYCDRCATLLPPGAGEVTWDPGQDDGGDQLHAGYVVEHLDQEACRARLAELARERRAEAAAKKKAEEEKEAREKAELEEQRRQIAALLDQVPDCCSTGYNWDPRGVVQTRQVENCGRMIEVPAWEQVSYVSHGGYLGYQGFQTGKAVTGEVIYLSSFGNASVLYGPRSVVEAAWESFLRHHPRTVEEARRSLELFGPKPNPQSLAERGCAGWELNAYVLVRAGIELRPEWQGYLGRR